MTQPSRIPTGRATASGRGRVYAGSPERVSRGTTSGPHGQKPARRDQILPRSIRARGASAVPPGPARRSAARGMD